METSPSNSAANLSSESVKLFVGGINESLKEEEIGGYFAKFGEVKAVVVVKDRATGNVRGFGFVEFADPDSAERALYEKEHAIGDRKVEVKRARPRAEHRRNYQYPHQYSSHTDYENRRLSNTAANNCCNENPAKLKKIFVGGLSSSITDDEFRSYFSKFGRITDTVIMYDSSTHRPRGFGFITFDSAEAVDSVLLNKYHELNNKMVEVKVAVPKDSNNQNNYNDSNGTMGGGRGSAISNHQGSNHQGCYYPPYSHRYGFYSGYAPQHVPGFFYGTPYGYGASYGAPYVARSPWPGMMGARRSPIPMYPGYFNVGFGGYAGMATTGFCGYAWPGDDKLSQTDEKLSQTDDKLNQTDNDVRITDDITGTDDFGNEKLGD